MEIAAIVALLLKLGDMALTEYAKMNEKKRDEILLAQNLLRQFADRMPGYIAYLNKYKDKTLTIDDLNAIPIEELNRMIDAPYETDEE